MSPRSLITHIYPYLGTFGEVIVVNLENDATEIATQFVQTMTNYRIQNYIC